jgi:hypothetical protein
MIRNAKTKNFICIANGDMTVAVDIALTYADIHTSRGAQA